MADQRLVLPVSVFRTKGLTRSISNGQFSRRRPGHLDRVSHEIGPITTFPTAVERVSDLHTGYAEGNYNVRLCTVAWPPTVWPSVLCNVQVLPWKSARSDWCSIV